MAGAFDAPVDEGGAPRCYVVGGGGGVEAGGAVVGDDSGIVAAASDFPGADLGMGGFEPWKVGGRGRSGFGLEVFVGWPAFSAVVGDFVEVAVAGSADPLDDVTPAKDVDDLCLECWSLADIQALVGDDEAFWRGAAFLAVCHEGRG